MDKRSITSTELAAFVRQLREQERAPGTIATKISSEGVNLDKQAFNAS